MMDDYHHGLFPHPKSAINRIVNGLAVVLLPAAGWAKRFMSARSQPFRKKEIKVFSLL
jgi:hypothetical protein